MVAALNFFRSFVTDPQTGGVLRSSGRALAEALTREIGHQSAPVIEFGPGSGAVTRALLERGVPQGRLVLIDRDADAARALRLLYPEADVYCADASTLRSIEIYDWDAPGAVVSRLPMMFMSQRKIYAILKGAFQRLRHDGVFYQLSYSGRCPVPATTLQRLGLEAVSVGWVWKSMPPARVYRIARTTISR